MERKLKLFISQPMNGLTENEILSQRADIIAKIRVFPENLHKCLKRAGLEEKMISYILGNTIEIEVVNPVGRANAPENAGRLWFLGQAIADMEKADLVIFAEGYSSANGCLAERRVAELYCIPFIDERDLWH